MNNNPLVVSLKCLNCNANLHITENVFEFACQYCGATQIVLRDGGIISLELIADKIDRVQSSIDKTSAELKMQRLINELKDLKADFKKIENSLAEIKSRINPIAVTVLALVCMIILLVFAFTESVIVLILGLITLIMVIGVWRKIVDKFDSEFHQAAGKFDVRADEIKQKISELKKITDAA